MPKRFIKLPTVDGVAANSRAVLRCPIGYRYHVVWLVAYDTTGTTLPCASTGFLGDIAVLLGGKMQRLHTGYQLNLMNQVNGSAYAAQTIGSSGSNYGQVVPIYFAEPWRKDVAQQEFCAWPTFDGAQLEIQMSLGSATGSLAVSAYAMVDNLLQPGMEKNGLKISKVYRYSLATAAAMDITTLDRRDVYLAFYALPPSSSISKMTFKADGVPIAEFDSATHAAKAQATLGLGTPFSSANGAELVLDADDPIQSGFPGDAAKDLQLRIEQGATSGVTTLLVERMGSPD